MRLTGGKERENPTAGLPWVEKYRPKKLEDMVANQDMMTTIRRYVEAGRLPHMLMFGPPGTGKTSTILACARHLFTPSQFQSMVLELNASDDRGIDVVREEIQSFCSAQGIVHNGTKLVVLDECDAMTRDAQNALRRIMEKYSDHVSFCLIGNYLSKIIPALQSRCARFRFAPLTAHQILPRLRFIIQQESLNVTEDGVDALQELAHGDMRRILNVLQSTSMAFDEVNEDTVYACVGQPSKKDIQNMVYCFLNDDFQTCYKKISEMKMEKGVALQDILTEVHLYVHRWRVQACASVEIPSHCVILLLEKMGEIEQRLATGCSEKIQLSALIAAFHMAREFISRETPVDEDEMDI